MSFLDDVDKVAALLVRLFILQKSSDAKLFVTLFQACQILLFTVEPRDGIIALRSATPEGTEGGINEIKVPRRRRRRIQIGYEVTRRVASKFTVLAFGSNRVKCKHS